MLKLEYQIQNKHFKIFLIYMEKPEIWEIKKKTSKNLEVEKFSTKPGIFDNFNMFSSDISI